MRSSWSFFLLSERGWERMYCWNCVCEFKSYIYRSFSHKFNFICSNKDPWASRYKPGDRKAIWLYTAGEKWIWLWWGWIVMYFARMESILSKDREVYTTDIRLEREDPYSSAHNRGKTRSCMYYCRDTKNIKHIERKWSAWIPSLIWIHRAFQRDVESSKQSASDSVTKCDLERGCRFCNKRRAHSEDLLLLEDSIWIESWSSVHSSHRCSWIAKGRRSRSSRNWFAKRVYGSDRPKDTLEEGKERYKFNIVVIVIEPTIG